MLQRFEGKTIEDALAAAASALGPDLQVTDARRIREGGLMGFFSRERFEVVAEGQGALEPLPPPRPLGSSIPAPAIAASSEPADLEAAQAHLDDTLRALVEGVESVDDMTPIPAPTSPPAPDASHTPMDLSSFAAKLADHLADDDLTSPDVPSRSASGISGPRAETIDVTEDTVAASPGDVEVSSHTPAAAAAALLAVRTEAAAPATLASVPAGEPAWTRAGLASLGLPAEVLDRLPVMEPDNDLEWTAALGRAIGSAVAPRRALGPDAPLSVSGHGRRSAVDLVVAGVAGFSADVIHIDGEAVPASPSELALAIRSLLPRVLD